MGLGRGGGEEELSDSCSEDRAAAGSGAEELHRDQRGRVPWPGGQNRSRGRCWSGARGRACPGEGQIHRSGAGTAAPPHARGSGDGDRKKSLYSLPWGMDGFQTQPQRSAAAKRRVKQQELRWR